MLLVPMLALVSLACSPVGGGTSQLSGNVPPEGGLLGLSIVPFCSVLGGPVTVHISGNQHEATVAAVINVTSTGGEVVDFVGGNRTIPVPGGSVSTVALSAGTCGEVILGDGSPPECFDGPCDPPPPPDFGFAYTITW
jgi:hypothetical protein